MIHIEKHFKGARRVRDVVLGMADGLIVPFALAAGLSGAVIASRIVVTAGLAEITAGAISMGLGGYLSAKTDREHYESERQREIMEIREYPQIEVREITDIFKTYGMTDEQIAPVIDFFKAHPEEWVNFMMRFELGLEKPDPSSAKKSAWTIALSYVVGGLIPLLPYFFLTDVLEAVRISAALTLTALFVFGYCKGRLTSAKPWRSAAETVFVGGLAAGTAFFLARFLSAG